MSWAVPTLAIILLTVFFTGTIALAGWPLARQSRRYTDAAEQVVLSILCGNIGLFILQVAVYLCRLSANVLRCAVFTWLLVSLAWFIQDWRRKRLAKIAGYLIPMLAWLGLGLLTLAAAVFPRVHGVPCFSFDWWEHYARTQVFLSQTPLANANFGMWTMAARGPLFNAVAAALLSSVGQSSYWAFSVASVVLNAQVLVPLALLLRRCAGKSMAAALLWCLATMLLVPALHFNLEYTWTKLATTGFILTALVMILKGADVTDSRLLGWGVIALAVAFLTHFMAFIYAVLLLAGMAYYLFAHRLPLRPVLIGLLIGTVLAGLWMVILFHAVGVRPTLRANSTLGNWAKDNFPASDLPTGPMSRLEFVGINLANTLLPQHLRALPIFTGTRLAPFPAYPAVIFSVSHGHVLQMQIPPMPDSLAGIAYSDGSLGYTGLGLILLALLTAAVRLRPPVSAWPWLWIYLGTVGLLVNVAATSWYAAAGCLHQNLQPYVCLAVVLVCTQFAHWPRWLGIILAGGWFIESTIRIGAIVQGQTARVQRLDASGALYSSSVIDASYLYNYQLKFSHGIVMLRDRFGDEQVWLAAAALVVAGLICGLAIYRWLRTGNEGETAIATAPVSPWRDWQHGKEA